MPQELSNRDLLRFLQNSQLEAGFFDRLKIQYRPLICPFVSLLKMIPDGARVGDVGCGSGQFLLLASNFAKPSFLYGIEIHAHLIENAKKLLPENQNNKSHFEVYDGINFPEALSEMDIIFLIDVLHHVPKKVQPQFLTNLLRSMKPNAKLIVKDIDASSPLVIFNKLHDLIFSHEVGNELSSKAVYSLLSENKMEMLDLQKKNTYVYPHYTIVAKKA